MSNSHFGIWSIYRETTLRRSPGLPFLAVVGLEDGATVVLTAGGAVAPSLWAGGLAVVEVPGGLDVAVETPGRDVGGWVAGLEEQTRC